MFHKWIYGHRAHWVPEPFGPGTWVCAICWDKRRANGMA